MATGYIMLPVLGFVPDDTNAPTLKFTAGMRPYWCFDDTTDQLAVIGFELPGNYASGLTIRSVYSTAAYVASSVVRTRTEWQTAADAESIDADSWSTVVASDDSSVPTTAGNRGTITDAITSVTFAANDYVALRFGRENATSGTNQTGDMEVWAVSLEYTTT